MSRYLRQIWNIVSNTGWLIVVVIVVMTPSSVPAQGGASGSIRGKVTDDTGGALPGVTATATSPALLVPQLLSVTDAEGNYAFPDLPIGTYRVVYEVGGFQRFVREEIVLRAGFSAAINVTMKIGALEESVTVSGETPVVDLRSTTPSVSLTNQVLTEVIPANRTLPDFLAVMPGILPRAKADLVGGQTAGAIGGSYGFAGQITNLIDGVNVRQDANAGGATPDMTSLEEFQVVTIAGNAEQALPGTFVNAIVKSGGNQFHGRYEAKGTHSQVVGSNLTPALRAQGLTSAGGVAYAYDTTGDLGGRIIRDKLWFYGAGHYHQGDQTPLGLSSEPGPDGIYNTADDVQGHRLNYLENETIKVTYQAARQYKLIGFTQRNAYTYNPNSVSRTLPLESTVEHHNDPTQVKVELQGTPSSRLFFNVMVGRHRYTATNQAQDGYDHKPSTRDNTTLINTGPAVQMTLRPRANFQPGGSVSYFTGDHDLKAGFSFYHMYQGSGQLEGRHGNYLLIFDTINGVPHQPFQIITYNFPLYPKNYMNESGLYVQDTWRLGSRTSLNLGLRYDRFHTWVPEQTKEPSQFSAGGTFPRLETGTWSEFAPRLGMAFNVTGDGKTVVKATYGRYNHTPADDFGAAYNKNTEVATTYRWRDLNNNGDYDPGEVNLNTNGPDFINITSAANNLLNPALKNPRTTQATVSLERELMANFGARLNYIYIKQSDLVEIVNVLRPYSAWNVALPRLDPGPDGNVGTTDDGGLVTVYDYDPAFRGSAFVGNQRVNRPSDRAATNQVLEAVVTRRTTSRWGLMGSAMVAKIRNWSVGVPQSPNDEFNNLYETWDWQGKLTGNYELPWRVSFSGTYQLYSGLQGARTYLFRSVPSASTVTLRMEPFGTRSSTVRSLLNLRVGKDVPGVRKGRLRVSLDILNAMNNASPWATSYTSGPTFGQISTIDSPRILHGGVTYSF